MQVPVVPTFSPAATFAKALYSSAGVEFDRVRILIVKGDDEVLKDTTVAFSQASADLTLPLVIAATPGQVVKATLGSSTLQPKIAFGIATLPVANACAEKVTDDPAAYFPSPGVTFTVSAVAPGPTGTRTTGVGGVVDVAPTARVVTFDVPE